MSYTESAGFGPPEFNFAGDTQLDVTPSLTPEAEARITTLNYTSVAIGDLLSPVLKDVSRWGPFRWLVTDMQKKVVVSPWQRAEVRSMSRAVNDEEHIWLVRTLFNHYVQNLNASEISAYRYGRVYRHGAAQGVGTMPAYQRERWISGGAERRNEYFIFPLAADRNVLGAISLAPSSLGVLEIVTQSEAENTTPSPAMRALPEMIEKDQKYLATVG